MASAPVKRFSLKYLYHKLARKGRTTTMTTYTTASPVLVSPQPAHKVIETELIFIIDYTPALPSIDSILALVKPAEKCQEPLLFSPETISGTVSPQVEDAEIEDIKNIVNYPSEEQDPAESSSKVQEELEDGSVEEGSETLFSSSEEGSSDVSSIITITTSTAPSPPSSPRFNPSFERSTPPTETDSPSLFTSNCASKLSASPSSRDISTWISLATKSLRFNPSFDRSPSPAASAESPSPLESSSFAEPDAFLSSSAPKSFSTLTTSCDDDIAPASPHLTTSIISTSERYPSFISWDSPSPRRRRTVQRAYACSVRVSV